MNPVSSHSPQNSSAHHVQDGLRPHACKKVAPLSRRLRRPGPGRNNQCLAHRRRSPLPRLPVPKPKKGEAKPSSNSVLQSHLTTPTKPIMTSIFFVRRTGKILLQGFHRHVPERIVSQKRDRLYQPPHHCQDLLGGKHQFFGRAINGLSSVTSQSGVRPGHPRRYV